MKLITTSWDDGHPRDFRIAELLDKYNLPGTFYIPKTNKEHEVMSEKNVCDLSDKFEIGGHTLSHIRLKSKTLDILETEINGCFFWLKDLLGYNPTSFCFPGGMFDKAGISVAKKVGFKIIRTVELLDPSVFKENELMPTTVQVYEHNNLTYFKHLIKRFSFYNLLLWNRAKRTSDILKLTDYYLNHILEHGGCFHLWGHSWEIEEYELWAKLEDLFKHLAYRTEFCYVTNGQVKV